jgi:hypothetical protein
LIVVAKNSSAQIVHRYVRRGAHALDHDGGHRCTRPLASPAERLDL